MFYTLKINALAEKNHSKNEVLIKFNKDPRHGKIHFITLDYKMTSNIYKRKTGQQAEKYQIEITCYDNGEKVTYLNTRKVFCKNNS
ncbi:hypothetical protein C900_00130 [Fulvivirga imtechensis AK7]|uniref:Uncharacterized protein n=1 Tax=Fulvivirga imtechensis AK7 TaxID=1237149 RepID=L8JW72_9BACT|nr:hypothetical protein [Fulvivirga imtechensis]ELR73050.1 hypothetical protein C900_00130 [Fulvivirga imtechensis AK7]